MKFWLGLCQTSKSDNPNICQTIQSRSRFYKGKYTRSVNAMVNWCPRCHVGESQGPATIAMKGITPSEPYSRNDGIFDTTNGNKMFKHVQDIEANHYAPDHW